MLVMLCAEADPEWGGGGGGGGGWIGWLATPLGCAVFIISQRAHARRG